MPEYSVDPVYNLFVRDEKDTIGLLAYAIYKSEEISFCTKSGHSYEQFVKVHTEIPQRVEEFKSKSRNLIALFGVSALQAGFIDMTNQQTQTLTDTLSTMQSSLKVKYRTAIIQSLIASFIYSVFLVIIYLIATFGDKKFKISYEDETPSTTTELTK